MLALLIPFSILAIVIFLIVGIMQGKNTDKKSSAIRSVYFYLTSLVTLAIVVGASVFLINIVLKTWVFPEADSVYFRQGPPETLYLTDQTGGLMEPGHSTIACDEECSITASQQNDIDIWASNYETWQESKDNPMSDIYDELAAAISFLIVALPFFIIHFRIVQKDAKKDKDQDKNIIRPTYFYFVSLASLIMVVIAGGMLINIGLKTWVFPESSSNNKRIETPSTAVKGENVTTPVQSLIDCADKCDIDEEKVTLAQQWIVDYKKWEDSDYSYNNNQRQAAAAIPYLLLGIPLFWYHWSIVRNRKKKEDKENIDNN